VVAERRRALVHPRLQLIHVGELPFACARGEVVHVDADVDGSRGCRRCGCGLVRLRSGLDRAVVDRALAARDAGDVADGEAVGAGGVRGQIPPTHRRGHRPDDDGSDSGDSSRREDAERDAAREPDARLLDVDALRFLAHGLATIGRG